MPEISVIIPVYNASSFIAETLDSLARQTFSDFELICVDDGSTDKTPQILETYAKQDQRIVILRQDNMGPGAARNKGLDSARGNYVCMLDADDLYDEQMLQIMHNRSLETDADVVVCRCEMFDDQTGDALDAEWTVKDNQLPAEDTFTPEDIQDFIFTAFMGWPWDKLYKRSFIEKNALRYPSLQNSEDLYFVFLANAKANLISIVDQRLVKHRMNRSNSVSTSRSKAPLDFYKSSCLLKKALKEDPILYSKFSWSFFNWAFEYMIWNINTMTDAAARGTQLKALGNGDFAELELDHHAGAFFALNPVLYGEYLDLLCEANDLPKNKVERQSFLNRLGWFLLRVDELGFGKAIKVFLGNKLGSDNADQNESSKPKIVRSSDYLISDRQALLRHFDQMNGESE